MIMSRAISTHCLRDIDVKEFHTDRFKDDVLYLCEDVAADSTNLFASSKKSVNFPWKFIKTFQWQRM